MKNSLKFLLLLSLVLGFSFRKPDVKSLKTQEGCIACNNDLERVINRIKNGATLRGGILIEQKYFEDNGDGSGERRIMWQGGFSYCGGTCFAVVTVTGHCLFGYCWGFQATSQGDEDCECGTFCPCTVN